MKIDNIKKINDNLIKISCENENIIIHLAEDKLEEDGTYSVSFNENVYSEKWIEKEIPQFINNTLKDILEKIEKGELNLEELIKDNKG